MTVGRKLLPRTLGLILLLCWLVGCQAAPAGTTPAAPTADVSVTASPGKITGKVTYLDLQTDGSSEPVVGAVVALCQLPVTGLPEGPAISSKNRDNYETICILRGKPFTKTNAEGEFTFSDVSPASYLVLFNLFPESVGAAAWDGTLLIEAPLNDVEMSIPATNELGFWEKGGVAMGQTNWDAQKGMVLVHANVCSNKVGFCFGLRDERLAPVVEVKAGQTVEAEVFTYFMATQQ